MRRMRHLIVKYFPYFLIFLVVMLLFFTNYVPGTWLSGWDNLHPEFDFQTNIIDRSIWSTWQEYQGLGVRAGNAHAADLIRQLGLLVTSFLFAPPFLRYFYHFFALFIGGMGAYELLRRIFGNDLSDQNRKTGATIGALFYILNLGTMQYFSVPYETFSHFFASLPWLLLTIMLFFERPAKQTLCYFSLASLLAIPMNYVPTVFIVYTMVLSILCTSDIVHRILMKKNLWQAVCPSFAIILVTLCINAYWLLPFAAFVRNGTDFVQEAKINRMFTQEAFLRNQQFGKLGDVAMLKGFLFNTTDLVSSNDAHGFIMEPWIVYLDQPAVRMLFYILFAGICVGYIVRLITKRPQTVQYALLFMLSLIALFTTNPPTGPLFSWLQDTLPLFKQIFRFPFTKILPVAALSYAIGFSYFSAFIVQKFRAIPKILFLCVTIGILIITQFPSFTGNFLYSAMRVTIPQEYMDVFSFFKTQDPQGRIANLPQATFWGWTAYDWGYRGSGFPWYGIRQPILDRAFDVWNPTNEAYYRELSLALYADDSAAALERVLKTYNISYIWLDERVIYPSNPHILLLEETKARLAAMPTIKKIYTSGKQTVYHYVNAHTSVRVDSNSKLTYPFAYLNNGKTTPIQETPNGVSFSAPLTPGTLTIPSFFHKDHPILTRITKQTDGILFQPLVPVIALNNNPIAIPTEERFVPLADLNNKLLQINNTLIPTSETSTIALLSNTNSIRLFADTPSQGVDISQPFFTKELHNCSGYAPSRDSVFGKEDQPSSIVLIGAMSKPCIYAPLSDLMDQKTLKNAASIVDIRFSYKTQNETPPTICLSKAGEQSCLPQKNSTTSVKADAWVEENAYVSIGDYPLSNLWLKIELDADGKQTTQKGEIKNVQVQLLPLAVDEASFSIPNIPDTIVTIEKPSTLTITIPSIQPTAANTVTFTDTTQAHNCYALGNGSYTKQILTDPVIGLYAQYGSHDSSSCDWKELQNPALSSGAVVSLLTRTVDGRPLKFCVKTDPPGFCLLEDILPTKPNVWTTSSYVLPAISLPASKKYFLELDDLAVGEENRINDVGPITVTSIPYTWLSAITTNNTTNDGVNTNDSITSVEHPNPAYYKIQITESGERKTENETLILSQSFDPGWKAYELPRTENGEQKTKKIQQWIYETFPFIFGKELKDHVLVNNWENGWTIQKAENGKQKTENANPSSVIRSPRVEASPQSSVIILFFLPQLLEWIGFLLLPIPFTFLFAMKGK